MAALETRSLLTRQTIRSPLAPLSRDGRHRQNTGRLQSEPWATSNQNAGRHQIGIGGRLRQNPQRDATGAGGLRERYPGSVYQSHPDAVPARLGDLSVGRGEAPLPCSQVSAGRLPAPLFGLARSGQVVVRRKPRFAKDDEAPPVRTPPGRSLPHHCRPQGVPRPPCPALGDPTRGKAPASGWRTPRAAGARDMAHTLIETPTPQALPDER